MVILTIVFKIIMYEPNMHSFLHGDINNCFQNNYV